MTRTILDEETAAGMSASLTKRRVAVAGPIVLTLAAALAVVAFWPEPEVTGVGEPLGLRFVRYTAGTDPVRAVAVMKAVFVVSNGTHRPIVGLVGPTEICTTNGVWELGLFSWLPILPPGHQAAGRPVVDGMAWFDLQTGQATNVQVLVAPHGRYRVPFAWGYASLTPAEQLQRRMGKFVEFRKKHGRWDGWRRTGSLICRTSIWETVGVMSTGAGTARTDGAATASGHSGDPGPARPQ